MVESRYRQVVTTIDSAAGAEELARGIVEARLGACVQIVAAVRSVYRWEGEVVLGDEWQCTVKTTADRTADLVAHIEANHPYDVPEVLVTPILEGSAAYLRWLDEECA